MFIATAMKTYTLAFVLAGLLLTASSVHGAISLTLLNPSFETVGPGDSLVDWSWGPTGTGFTNAFISNKNAPRYPQTPEGNFQALLITRDTANLTWIYQPLGTVEASDVGSQLSLSAISAVRYETGLNHSGGTARVGFYTGVTTTVSGTNVGDDLGSASLLLPNSTSQTAPWFTLTDTITITPDLIGQQLYVRLSVLDNSLTTAGSSRQTYFDNVVVTAVPEPASLLLCAVGGALILGRRRA
jgi:hypothetical protein